MTTIFNPPPALKPGEGPRNLIAVTTCPRPQGACYLIETLRALDREGAKLMLPAHKLVLSDGSLSEDIVAAIPAGWTLIMQTGASLGPRRNMWTAFRMALAQKAQRLLYFEDDVQPCKNAVKYMCQLEVPQSMAMISFHDSKEFSPGTTFGMYRMRFPGRDARGLFGVQALMIPEGTLKYLALQDPWAIWKSNPAKYSDRTLEVYLYMSHFTAYAVHIPCLVRHVGGISAAHPGKSLEKRQTSNFPGEDFDACSLRLQGAFDIPVGMPLPNVT